MDIVAKEVEIAERGFSKALKTVPVRVLVTVTDPELGTAIKITLGFRRMSDGEARRLQEQNAVRTALTERVARGDVLMPADAARAEMTMGDIVDVLAPLFVDQRGIDDWPRLGTPEDQFRAYFSGDGTEQPEDLEVEGKIVQAAYMGYLNGAFRLVPAELVQAVSLLLGRDAPSRPVESEGRRPVV